MIFYINEEQIRGAEKSKKPLQVSNCFTKPIVTKIEPVQIFYPAEAYHHDYYKKNPFHYKLYRKDSRRAGFIRKNWKENPK